MDFWNEIHSATEAVRLGKENPEEPPELAHLPDHVKHQLLSGGSHPDNSNSRQPVNDNESMYNQLPEHLKNNPYAHMSRKEIMELYEDMKKNPNAYKLPPQNIDEEMQQKAAREGKPYIDPEGGCTIQPQKGFVVKSRDQNGQKIFVNMVSHELVDPPEEKPMPDSDQPAVRIPMSVGDVREDFDKKGDPCQVIDVIWNPDTVKKAKKEMLYKQGLVELSFGYIKEKYGYDLNLRYTQPANMKYKGKTVQWQRVRAKKNPKIEQLNSQPLSEEEQQKIQSDSFAKVKEESFLKKQKVEWKLYCVKKQLKDQIFMPEWWEKQVLMDKLEILADPDAQDEEDKADDVNNFLDGTDVDDELVEEYDGLNQNFAFFVALVKMEMLMRGHAIKLITQGKKLKINLCDLTLNFPEEFDKSHSKAFFDCKRRTLAIILPLHGLMVDNVQEDAGLLVQELQAVDEEGKDNDETKDTDLIDGLATDDMAFDLV